VPKTNPDSLQSANLPTTATFDRKRQSGPARVVEVETAERCSAGLVRIVFGGPELAGFTAGEFTDHYVKLHFPPHGAVYKPPFDPAEVRATLPRQQWSRTRTYTVRQWDPDELRLTIDFVVHGDEGIAGPWALAARRGDRLQLVGPGGAYAPDPTVGWHLFVGDESALPAIAASLERIPPDHSAYAVIQVPGPEHHVPLHSPRPVTVDWLDGARDKDVLAAVESLDFCAGARYQAFVHGEASIVRLVRRHLLVDRALEPTALSASGYWKRDRTEEGWRDDKAEWKRLADADLIA
jgi:NADPH-dependent ferric siderophore reductase